ncbi:hypothetical protein R1sor_010845 [Riccia sorocarpa]|uniref:Reverse transcriptase zinc-binding domain-containing protein n=1 Tax=Riccia sorocarpa TaxID=122646 RepID=A0ABD3I597_9MARC
MGVHDTIPGTLGNEEEGWRRSTKVWSTLLNSEEKVEILSDKWSEDEAKLTWQQRWSQLWKGGGSTRTKTWIWRVLKGGFFTGERTEKIGVSTDPRFRCRRHSESICHLFWDCEKAACFWRQFKQKATMMQAKFNIWRTLLGTIDEALICRKKGGTLIHILGSALQAIWTDRCKKVHGNQDSRTPLAIVLNQARYEVEESLTPKGPATNWNQSMAEWEELTSMLSPGNDTTGEVTASEESTQSNREAEQPETTSGENTTIRKASETTAVHTLSGSSTV